MHEGVGSLVSDSLYEISEKLIGGFKWSELYPTVRVRGLRD